MPAHFISVIFGYGSNVFLKNITEQGEEEDNENSKFILLDNLSSIPMSFYTVFLGSKIMLLSYNSSSVIP